MLFAAVFKDQVKTVSDLIADRLGDGYAPGRGHALQTRRHIHPIAVDVVAFDNDIAEIYADAKLNATIIRHRGRACLHCALEPDRTGDSADNTRKFRENSIAGEFYDAALVLGDFALNDFATDFFQLRKRSGFIAFHQPAVTDDVGCQDRGEANVPWSSEYAPETDQTSGGQESRGEKKEFGATNRSD